MTGTTVLEIVLGRNLGSTSPILRHQFPASRKTAGESEYQHLGPVSNSRVNASRICTTNNE